MPTKSISKTEQQLRLENEALHTQLAKAEESLYAIHKGKADAIVISGPDGEKVYSTASAETPYRIIVEEMNEGAVVLSADGIILYCNRRFTELVSVSPEQITGSCFTRFIAESDRPKYDSLLQAGLKGKSIGEFTCLVHDSFPVHLHLSFSPLPPDLSGDVCIIATDISELKQKEEELHRSYNKLEQGIIERTAELTKTIEELAASRLAIMNMMEDAVEAKDSLEITNKKLFEEIAERKLAEKDLRESQSLYHSFIEQLPNGVFRKDSEGRYVLVNSQFCKLKGLRKEDFIGRKPREIANGKLTKPENQELIAKYADIGEDMHERIMQTGKLFETEEEYPDTKSGTRYMHIMRMPVFDFSGMIIGTQGIMFDITESKRAEEELAREQYLMQTLMDRLPDHIYFKDRDSRFIRISKSLAQSFGLSDPEQAVGKTDFDFFTEEHARQAYEDEQTIIRTGTPLIKEEKETWANRPDTWTLTTKLPLHDKNGDIIGTFGISIDITERKRAEYALLLKNFVFDVSLAANSISNANGIITQVNDAFLKSWGYENFSEVIGKPISHFLNNQEDAISIINALNTLGKWECDYIARKKDGSCFVAHGVSTILKDEKGDNIGYQSSVLDITERKHTEEEVRNLNIELEERVRERTAALSDLYNNAPCGYHLLDNDGLFVRINDTELKWLGYAREEIVGKKRFSDLLTTESAREFVMIFPVSKEQGWINDLELEMVRKDGSFLPVVLSATSITDSEGNYRMSRSTIVDNTERKLAEETMFESQNKLEHLNRELEAFAYSVSHDLRAPLRAIDGFTRILMEEYSTIIDEEGQRLCRVISDNSIKMGQLIDDLLAFSRLSRSAVNYTMVDMKVLAAKVFNEIAKPEKKIHFDMQELPAAFCDQALLKQVWINLLSNAVKFTQKCNLPHIVVGFKSSYTEITYFVDDNGVGFEQKYANKLFGVFQRLHNSAEFEGTGVGLAIVQRIINRHGGRVWAEGEIQKGATFYFTLPVKK